MSDWLQTQFSLAIYAWSAAIVQYFGTICCSIVMCESVIRDIHPVPLLCLCNKVDMKPDPLSVNTAIIGFLLAHSGTQVIIQRVWQIQRVISSQHHMSDHTFAYGNGVTSTGKLALYKCIEEEFTAGSIHACLLYSLHKSAFSQLLFHPQTHSKLNS